MLNYIQLHQKQLIIYFLIHLATYILFIRILSKPHLKHYKNPELAKYKAFARNDVKNWRIIKCAPFWLTFWPRVLVGVLNTLFLTTFVLICMIGVTDSSQIGKKKKRLLGMVTYLCCRLHAFNGGLYWIEYEYVSTGEGDYRKWLGPDWKPQWSGASTIV